LRSSVDELFAALKDDQRSGLTRASALEALEYFGDPRLEEAVAIAAKSDSSELRLAAQPVAARLSPEAVLPVLEALAVHGNTEEQRTAYKALADVDDPEADRILAGRLRALAAGEVEYGAQIELLEAAAKRDDPTVKQLLADREAALAASDDPLAGFEPALEGGNVRAGTRVFYNNPVMACQRCHQVMGHGGAAGPDLSLVGTRKTRRELLESVIEPNATIAEGFESVAVTTRNGDVSVGSVAGETDSVLSLRLLDGSVAEIQKSEIVKRDGAPSSMPPIYRQVLSKREMRDLIEFLAQLNVDYTAPHGPRALMSLDAAPEMPDRDTHEE